MSVCLSQYQISVKQQTVLQSWVDKHCPPHPHPPYNPGCRVIDGENGWMDLLIELDMIHFQFIDYNQSVHRKYSQKKSSSEPNVLVDER